MHKEVHVGKYLLSRSVATQVSSAQQSLTEDPKIFRVRNGNVWTLCVKIPTVHIKEYKVSEFTNLVCWRIPIVPERRHSSIVGTTELNFCVRNGNRWTLCVNLTNYSLQLCFTEPQSLHPSEMFPSSAGIMHLQGFEPGTH